uniref:NADH-ubiquinone oxidoreductase chain 1 n=1 Tax=Melipona scutellaris TaxID=263364 RepID=A0A0B4U1P8_9HYME|nr:NADH dehydrogenase subunit 1 [Melipona scutellaris]AJC00755.1 NADH dehydrogenase subunit 1 [Melipona scutellaris]
MMMLILNYILLMIMVMLSVAFLTLFERKILSYMQCRKGPNKLLFKGLFQPFSDMLKLIFKEMFYLSLNKMFYLSPMFMFYISCLLWLVYPWIYMNINMMYMMVFLLFVMSLNVYPILIISWISMNNYSMMGLMRLVSQMISFEVLMFLIIFMFMMIIEDFKFMYMYIYQLNNFFFFIYFFPLYFMLFISLLIDLNRVPFDLIEGESELVSGFNLEYYSGLFIFIFLSEYMNLLFMSIILTIFFFGFYYWSIMFNFIYLMNLFLMVMIRGVLARIRYDSLMYMCWMELLVLMLFYLIYFYLMKELIMLINY